MPLSDQMSIQPVNLQCWPERSSILSQKISFLLSQNLGKMIVPFHTVHYYFKLQNNALNEVQLHIHSALGC